VGLLYVAVYFYEYLMCGNDPASYDECYGQVIKENKERITKTGNRLSVTGGGRRMSQCDMRVVVQKSL
jgi:hypothetical protein